MKTYPIELDCVHQIEVKSEPTIFAANVFSTHVVSSVIEPFLGRVHRTSSHLSCLTCFEVGRARNEGLATYVPMVSFCRCCSQHLP